MKSLKSQRLHIGIFGKTNVGKSSILNKITGQDISIVSDIEGTTTDVVEKSMELLPIGAVNFLDTAGVNDLSSLGTERLEKTIKVINRIDIAVIVCDYNGLDNYDIDLIHQFNSLDIPFIILINKTDISQIELKKLEEIGEFCKNFITTSAINDDDLIYKFKNTLINMLPEDFVNPPKIAGDLVEEKSTVILVIPIDKEAPKGRLILPQVQVIRDLLDSNCNVLCVKETELKEAIENLKNSPSLVITDSQAFKTVSETVPQNIPLTSFSILFARLKGDLATFINGAKTIDNLKDGDKVLILESCTHHAIEDDIGKVKIPKLLRKKTGKDLVFEHFSGHDFPEISQFKLIIHCGACMTNRREVLSRIIKANNQGIPITNYGITISYCLGILDRAVKIFRG